MKAIALIWLTTLAGCGAGSVTTSTDVKLQNATAHVTSSGTYELTFAVLNGATRAIDRVEDVRLSTGGQPLQNATAVSCGASPWTLPPGGSSGVVSVDVTFGSKPTLAIECNGSALTQEGGAAFTTLVSPPSAPAGSFDVRIQGLLTDAEPFVATANAPIL